MLSKDSFVKFHAHGGISERTSCRMQSLHSTIHWKKE